MSWFDALMQRLAKMLSSKVSIIIYLFLFVYLVVFALLAALVPALSGIAPSADTQLIMGNYTNVLSALGASIAAGAGVAAHRSVKRLHDRHDALQKSIAELHAKLDRLDEAAKAQ